MEGVSHDSTLGNRGKQGAGNGRSAEPAGRLPTVPKAIDPGGSGAKPLTPARMTIKELAHEDIEYRAHAQATTVPAPHVEI